MAWPPAQVHIAARQWPLSHLPAVTSERLREFFRHTYRSDTELYRSELYPSEVYHR